MELFIFRWMNDVFRKGFKRPLENSDVYKILPQDETKGLADRLERCAKQLLVCLYDDMTILIIYALTLPFHWLRAHYVICKYKLPGDNSQCSYSLPFDCDLAANSILFACNCVCFCEILWFIRLTAQNFSINLEQLQNWF